MLTMGVSPRWPGRLVLLLAIASSIVVVIVTVTVIGIVTGMAPMTVMANERGDLRLVDAARVQDAAAVQTLVNQQLPVDIAQPDGATALHWAAHWNNLQIADLLIHAGADVNVTNELGVAPLSLACISGSAEMVERLLDRDADANHALPTGVTSLMTCARTGSVDAVRSLLDHGARVNEQETVWGQTALMWAIAERHTDVVAALVAAGADIGHRTDRGFTPLLFAAQQGAVESAAILLEAGTDVNEVGSDGSAALLVATESGHTDMVRFLLDAGADVHAIGTGRTALHASVQGARPDIATVLLDGGADPNARLQSRLPRIAGDLSNLSGPMSWVGATPFWLAAKFTDREMMRLFADRGADTRLTTEDGTTPLMVAVGIGYVDGYDRYGNLRFDGYSARREQNDLEAAKVALALGGDVTTVNEHGQTVMHGAAYLGSDAIVRFLADLGAEIDRADNEGRTPLSIADGLYVAGTFVIQESTAALLRQLGAEKPGD
jgi:ankyrin repeat protein